MLTETTRECPTVEYEIRLHHDYASTPHDADCYTPKQIAAWENDEWRFVGVIPTVFITENTPGCVTVLIECGSLWGVEYGDLPYTDADDNLLPIPEGCDRDGSDYVRSVALELLADAEQTLRRFSLRPEDLPAPRIIEVS
jgi:hypothetical protein